MWSASAPPHPRTPRNRPSCNPRARAARPPGPNPHPAAAAAPALQRLLLQVEAARKATDPESLAAGPPRMRIAGVRGAPGDGNEALAARIRDLLGAQGFVVQDSAEGAAYALEAEVAVAPPARGVQRVEIQWIVIDALGREDGRVVQINEVPKGSLDLYWGEVAQAAAQQAAGGIRDVMANQLATRRNPQAGVPPQAAPP